MLLVAFSPAGKMFSAGLFNRSFHVRRVFFCKPLFKRGESGLDDFGETESAKGPIELSTTERTAASVVASRVPGRSSSPSVIFWGKINK